MLEHPTLLAVFTSQSQEGRLKTTGGTLPLTSSILWRRITNRSLLSTTYPRPKLTLTYCVETVGQKAEGVLTCSWYFLHCWENATFSSIVMQPVGKTEISHLLHYKERKPMLLRGLWLVSNAPTMWNLCTGHPSQQSLRSGRKLISHPCWDSIWRFHCAYGILPPSGFDQATYFSTLCMTVVSYSSTRQPFDELQPHNTENIQTQMCCFFWLRYLRG